MIFKIADIIFNINVRPTWSRSVQDFFDQAKLWYTTQHFCVNIHDIYIWQLFLNYSIVNRRLTIWFESLCKRSFGLAILNWFFVVVGHIFGGNLVYFSVIMYMLLWIFVSVTWSWLEIAALFPSAYLFFYCDVNHSWA